MTTKQAATRLGISPQLIGKEKDMKDYAKLTIRELRDAVAATGTNPFGMTKSMMVDCLVNTDKARSMSLEELYSYLVSVGKI